MDDKLIFWGAITLICVVPTIAHYVYRWRKSELDAELKHEMIVRGMSADEIVRVLGAKSESQQITASTGSPGSIPVTQDWSGRSKAQAQT